MFSVKLRNWRCFATVALTTKTFDFQSFPRDLSTSEIKETAYRPLNTRKVPLERPMLHTIQETQKKIPEKLASSYNSQYWLALY